MNKFLRAVAEVLEVDEVELSTEFRQTPGWCSLHGFGLLVMLENDWGARVDIERFLQMKTVRDLYMEAIIAFAAGVFGVERSALSADTAYESIPEWDSVNHLRLVMEAEKYFGVRYELERIPEMKRLSDFAI